MDRAPLLRSLLFVPLLACAVTAVAVQAPATIEVAAPEPTDFVNLGRAVHWLGEIDLRFDVDAARGRLASLGLIVHDGVIEANDRLEAYAQYLPLPVPDLRMLTVSPVEKVESSGYGWRDDPFHHDRRFHYGTDFHAKPGTTVMAAGPGTVVYATWQSGYGKVVYIDHGGGVITRYGHLRRITTKKGATVAAGDQIGEVGSTGHATGPHLHFEVRLDGRAVDPVTAMTVASLERDHPAAGHIAAFSLAPAVQAKSRDHQDATNRRTATRPERAGRTKRAQVLW